LGYYYDPNTGLYFSAASGQWYSIFLIILACGLSIFMLTFFSLCLSVSGAKHGYGFERVFFSCFFKFILDL